jgi:DNA-binding transcriptional LysR family regulator
MNTGEIQHGLEAKVFASRLKLKHLTLFRHVCELQTLRKGAEAANITQPAATKLIQELEALFGVTLFHRDRSGMRPTLHGNLVRRYAEILLADVDKMHEEVGRLSAGITGRIRLGVVPSLSPALLTQSIVHTLKDRSQVSFSIQEGSTTVLLSGLRSNELDLVLGRVVDLEQIRGMKVTSVYTEPFAIVCAVDHPLAARKHTTWRELASYQWVLAPAGTPTRQLADDLFTRNQVIRPGAAVESSSFGQMRYLISQSELLGMVPRSIALRSASRGDLAVLKGEVGEQFAPISLISRSDIDQPPLIEAFSRVLSETAAAMNLK